MQRTRKVRLITAIAGAAGAIALAACVPLKGAPPTPGAVGQVPQTYTATFNCTGAFQNWTVPTGVTQATFDLYGAEGGAGSSSSGGKGGRAAATLTVTPGETILVTVGCLGGPAFGVVGGPAGFWQAGSGGDSEVKAGGGGGGASDVRQGGVAVSDRVLVAGGGGGGGGYWSGPAATGGTGGYPAGGDGGGPAGGDGGTQSVGGVGCVNTCNGGLGFGGNGWDGTGIVRGGGGGGGGLYGGGGGHGSTDSGGGGGGGSSFGPAGTAFQNGVRTGHGLVTITYTV